MITSPSPFVKLFPAMYHSPALWRAEISAYEKAIEKTVFHLWDFSVSIFFSLP
jgi:hypothetical protein